jgi:hypothetical protein
MNNKTSNKDPTIQHESIPELLGNLAKNSAAVVHDEIELVIQRMREKIRSVRNGGLLVAAGAFIGLAAFLSLCAALIIGLTEYMSPAIAALATGIVLVFFAVVIAYIGYRQLNRKTHIT